MSKAIDLGKSLSDMVSVREIGPDKKHYPDLCIDTDDKNLAQMPDQGTATIKYRVVSRTHREEKNGKGKEYSCTLRLEVVSIEPPASKKKPSNNGYGDDVRKNFQEYFKDK